ncbi:aldehyde dehydrogenase family protein [Salinispora arenicola]|uniref:aldehyde dehydrogenase family protein n=1 Tax=Salinispora arenicola TaxID=168697 RepID=UPI00207A7280|nr:aldehyde dehydrogenase family protein [Salinispora arenicola]MCN0152006.1 aldehyde dehydrogenase family protein [Salinispora arenicola]
MRSLGRPLVSCRWRWDAVAVRAAYGRHAEGVGRGSLRHPQHAGCGQTVTSFGVPTSLYCGAGRAAVAVSKTPGQSSVSYDRRARGRCGLLAVAHRLCRRQIQCHRRPLSTKGRQMGELGMTIDGSSMWGRQTFGVVDPATGAVFAHAPVCTVEQLDQAMDAALRAFHEWRREDDVRRAALRECARVLLGALDELATTITAEQGKPRAASVAEVVAAVSWLRYYAELDIGREIVQDDRHGYADVVRRPLGVVAAITPWNFPVALAMWKLAPALRAGNTVVLKPSPYAPMSALMTGELLGRVLPAGVVNVVTGPDPLGDRIVTHPVPRMVSFTGSVVTGRRVAAAAAGGLKRMTLELGGNDPAVVLDDVDPEQVADDIFWAALADNGQRCMAAKRVYVARHRHDDLVEALAARARATRVGPGSQPSVQLGPLGNQLQVGRMAEYVRDALAHGAALAAGGTALDRPGYFYAPTVLAGATDGVRVVDEEQFGPVLPVIAYRDVDDAVNRANASDFGLTASVWSADLERANAVAARLDAGQVSVNAHAAGVRPDLPFGGHKCSGIGVENGVWGLHSFTDLQATVRPAPKRRRQTRTG